MKDSASITNKENKAVLSITPLQGDHTALRKVFNQAYRNQDHWKLLTASSVEWATNLLRQYTIPIAICERDLQPGTWRDLLEETATMPHSPLVIVTSLLADERLWAEVLNEGGYDVLAKPFDGTEVIRVVEGALRRWQDQHGSDFAAPRKLKVAS
jgi:DNA-binding NtrC family response regulator